jgi:hypothetical protein
VAVAVAATIYFGTNICWWTLHAVPNTADLGDFNTLVECGTLIKGGTLPFVTYVVLKQYGPILRALCDRVSDRIDWTKTDANGLTPLMVAAIIGSAPLAEMLLAVAEVRANVNQKNMNGRTALIIAAKYAHVDLLSVFADLPQSLLDVHASDDDAMSALNYEQDIARDVAAKGWRRAMPEKVMDMLRR